MSGATRLALSGLLLVAGVTRGDDGALRPTPYFDLESHRPEWVGPGRETAPPAALAELELGFFGPTDPDHPELGEAWRGATLAVEEVNAAGGIGGRPLRLVGSWAADPWGAGVAGLARLVYQRPLVAILGGVDGATTHLAEQVVVKARLPLLSPGGTDPSVNLTNVPWMFTLPATDERLAPVLVDLVGDAGGAWAVLTAADRDARLAWTAVERAAAGRLPPPTLHLVVERTPAHATAAARAVTTSGARTALVLAGPADSARLVAALRAAAFAGAVVGGAAAGRRPFAELAGAAAEGVRFPLLFDPAQPAAAAFVIAYRARWSAAPDWLAAHAYDGVRLLADGLRVAGPNRALLRDALVALTPWPGVTGELRWDATGRSTHRVGVGVWRDGLLPVLEAEVHDPCELSGVVGDQGQLVR